MQPDIMVYDQESGDHLLNIANSVLTVPQVGDILVDSMDGDVYQVTKRRFVIAGDPTDYHMIQLEVRQIS